MPKSKNFDLAIANSKKRIQDSPQFKLIDESAQWLSKRKDDNVHSLNIDKFKKEQQEIEGESKKFKAITAYKNNLSFNSLPYETALMAKDSVFKEKRVRWHESLTKDVYVEEALNVLKDLQSGTVVKSVQPIKTKKKVANTI